MNRFSAPLLPNTHVPQSDRNYLAVPYDERAREAFLRSRNRGEVALWDEIRFPFDPALAGAPDLHTTAVAHSPAASSQLIEERYECDSGGSLTVTIANRTAAYSGTYCLGRWSLNSKSVKPVRKGKGKQ